MLAVEGAEFHIRPRVGSDELVVTEVFRDQCYGPPDLFTDAKVIVDIGANIGAFSIYVALCTNPDTRIIAVEPEKWNFSMLEKNVQHNKLEHRIELRNHAISNQDVVFMPLEEGGNSATALEISDEYPRSVTAETLDSVIGEFPEISFLKVDTEGHESIIFGGLSDANLKKIQRFAFEYHGNPKDWGLMIRSLTHYHDLAIESETASYLYGGLCKGTLR